MVCMGVYVDDIVFAAKTDEQLKHVKSALAKQSDIKDLGKLRYFLGISDDDCKSVWIGQPVYTENLLTKYSMQNYKPVSTPVEPGTKLKIASETDECVDKRMYQSTVGSLMYHSFGTRPDTTYIVSNLVKFSEKDYDKPLECSETCNEIPERNNQTWNY